MPEGDTIFRIAVRLRAVMEGKRIDNARSRDKALDVQCLVGDEANSVEARGKHLLIEFNSGVTLHSHLGMTGSWHLYQLGEAWRKPRNYASVELDLEEAVVACFSPKTLELLSAVQLRRHQQLNRLGPDLLSCRFDQKQVVPRFRTHNQTPVGEAVMNQTIVCGVGNVYKSELLFLLKMHPLEAVGSFNDERLCDLLDKARDLMSRNLSGFPRQTRFAGDGQKKWVYGRSGKPCFKCGERIQVTRQGNLGRTTYYCPSCQAMP